MHASSTSVHRRVRYVHDGEEFHGQFRNTPATIAAVGDGPEPDVVGYGDSHDPFYETQYERRTLFNAGSVGNAVYDPTPLYVVLEGVVGSLEPAPFGISFVRVPYDVEAGSPTPAPSRCRPTRAGPPSCATGSTAGRWPRTRAGEWSTGGYFHR